jgi:hypothetical protein
MELYLQFGHQMRLIVEELIHSWGGGTVILSPKHQSLAHMTALGTKVQRLNGAVLLDPQFYVFDPRRPHPQLSKHNYWPKNYSTSMLLGGPELQTMLAELRFYNDQASTSKYIVPSRYLEHAEDVWFAAQEAMIGEAAAVFTDKPLLATICISGEALRDESQIEAIIAEAESWKVDGYYVVPDHERDWYLVHDTNWFANLLLLCAGLRLHRREVVVGYSSHQMLSLAAANVTAIASGSFYNTRAFVRSNFDQPEQPDRDSGRNPRPTWYYCPQALSEYRLESLDVASRLGTLSFLEPNLEQYATYVTDLFTKRPPTSSGFRRSLSFLHYLDCLHFQGLNCRQTSFRETLEHLFTMIDDAEKLVDRLEQRKIYAEDKSFLGTVGSTTKGALAILEDVRGHKLDMQW